MRWSSNRVCLGRESLTLLCSYLAPPYAAFDTGNQGADDQRVDDEDGSDHCGNPQHQIEAAVVVELADAPHRRSRGREVEKKPHGVNASAPGGRRVTRQNNVVERHLSVNRANSDGER